MKKRWYYILSIAGHALVLLIILSVHFPITIQPGPSRVVVVRIAEPPTVTGGETYPTSAPRGTHAPPAAAAMSRAGATGGTAPGGGVGPASSRGSVSFSGASGFSLRASAPGSFHLAPVGKSPEPWAVPIGPGRPTGLQRFRPGDFRPGTAPGGAGGPGDVFLLPFDTSVRAVADWSEAVLSRVERNWIIPASGRLGISGRVQVTLVIERQGGQRSLVVDDATVP